ncbi:SRPBCC family protein [Cohnella candidum]|uniref:SRPBCC family protein n=1 Tax=Cohnella candidum TaxID=2674991 RepID=A0A3G3K3I5_9BACL|nr:SRPBCC family protein [Cohnella candidum]AYQ75028.1 hypothetical protein EAV92_22195 [Cohnella candidum]
MARCEMAVEIDAPVETVWALTQNAGRRPEWDYRILKVTLLNAESPDTGVKLRSEGKMGRRFHLDMEYVAFEPNRRSAVKMLKIAGMPFAGGGGSWRYEAIAPGKSRFQTTIQMNPKPSAIMRWADKRLLEPMLKWMTKRSLNQLKLVAEADARKASHSAFPPASALGREA